jgi:hypothetical protein
VATPLSDALAARRAGLIAAALAGAAGLVPALNGHLVGVFYDDGLYAGLATALAHGAGYAHPHLPGAPAAVHYPPRYPLVLAPLFGLLPVDAAAHAAKLLNLLLAAAAAGLVARHAVRARLLGPAAPWWVPAAVVAAAATAIPVLATQSVLFAEPLFAVLLTGAVMAGDRAAAEGDSRAAWGAGALCALALLTRTIGIAAAAGVAAFIVLRRRAPSLATRAATPAAAAAAGWLAWVAAHRGDLDPALGLNYGAYADALSQAGLATLGVSAPDLPRPLAALTLGWIPSAAAVMVLGAAALGLELYGLWLLARRSSIGLTLVAYLAILALWPYPPDRFLWAVLPWLALAASAAVADLVTRARWRLGAIAVAAALLLGFAVYQVRGLAGRWWDTAARGISGNFRELLPAIRHLPDSAVVATDDEALVWLYSGRRAVPLYVFTYRGRETVTPPPLDHRAYLERQGVTHVLLASASGESATALRDLLRADAAWLEPVERWSGGRWLFAVRAARR